MTHQTDLRAREAADMLGISLSTLYSYVSRGLIQSRPAGDGHRERVYARADVEALKERQTQRRDPARVAVTALNWGTPVLESAITLIENGRLYYRGHDALELARQRTFEEVIGLLWTNTLAPPESLNAAATPIDLTHVPGLESLSALERWQILLPLLQSTDPAAYDLRPAPVQRAGGVILQSMVNNLTSSGTGRISERLARTFARAVPSAARLIDAALILSADHELNASSFTVRCVASARATLYDAIDAGIGALRGIRHGASSYRIEALLDEVSQPGQAASVLEDRLRRGEPIPGIRSQSLSRRRSSSASADRPLPRPGARRPGARAHRCGRRSRGGTDPRTAEPRFRVGHRLARAGSAPRFRADVDGVGKDRGMGCPRARTIRRGRDDPAACQIRRSEAP